MSSILVLGGTGFVARHITEAALAAGHDVTLFNARAVSAGLVNRPLVGTAADTLEWARAHPVS